MTSEEYDQLKLPDSIRQKYRADRVQAVVREPKVIIVQLTNGAKHTFTRESFWWKLTGVR